MPRLPWETFWFAGAIALPDLRVILWSLTALSGVSETLGIPPFPEEVRDYSPLKRCPFTGVTQAEQVWLVYAGFTRTTSLPASSALQSRCVKNIDHDAS